MCKGPNKYILNLKKKNKGHQKPPILKKKHFDALISFVLIIFHKCK